MTSIRRRPLLLTAAFVAVAMALGFAVGTVTRGGATHAIDFGAYVQPQGSETAIEAFQRFEAAGGDLDVTRHYLWNWTSVPKSGLIVWSAEQGHTLKVAQNVNAAATGITWVEVAAGEQDAFLTEYATWLQGLGVPVWFEFENEPDNNPEAGTAAEYKAALIHVYDLMKPLCPNCQIGTSLMRNTFTGSHGGHLAWLPDNAHMDFVGADLYANYGSTTPLSTLAGPSLTYARSIGKPYLIGEAGIAGTGRQKQTWLRAARTFLTNNTDIVAFVYSETVAQGGDFRVSTTTRALNAWRAITGDPYFQ